MRHARWVGWAAWWGAAASAVALGALTAGSASARGDVLAGAAVLADAPPLTMAPLAPTPARRALAVEAARLTEAHPQQERLIWETEFFRESLFEPGDLATAIDLASYGRGNIGWDGGVGTITQVAIRLYLAGHDDVVRGMSDNLRISRHPDKQIARLTLRVLTGDLEPTGPELNMDFVDVTAKLMILTARTERAFWTSGQLEAARPAAIELFRYFDASFRIGPPAGLEAAAFLDAAATTSLLDGLAASGRLLAAHRFAVEHPTGPDCAFIGNGPRFARILDQLALAEHWPQLMELVAASNRTCLRLFLDSHAAGLALQAGHRDAMGAVLRTALARPVGEISPQSDLIRPLAERGFIEEAEQQIAAYRDAGRSVAPASRAAVAAAAVVAGDRPMLDRHWNQLDHETNGETPALAEYVVIAALKSGRALGDWRGRAVEWLGIDDEALDWALSHHVTLLDPVAVRGSSALTAFVRGALAHDVRGGAVVDDGDANQGSLGRLEPKLALTPLYRRADLQLAVWDRVGPIEATSWFDPTDRPAFVDVATAAAGWYRDPLLLEQLLTIAEAQAGDAFAAEGSGQGLCLVAVQALYQAAVTPRAVGMLASADLFARDQWNDRCRIRAAGILALRGYPDEAVRIAHATTDPAARALALAYALAPPVPAELMAWHDEMRLRGPLAERPRHRRG